MTNSITTDIAAIAQQLRGQYSQYPEWYVAMSEQIIYKFQSEILILIEEKYNVSEK